LEYDINRTGHTFIIGDLLCRARSSVDRTTERVYIHILNPDWNWNLICLDRAIRHRLLV